MIISKKRNWALKLVQRDKKKVKTIHIFFITMCFHSFVFGASESLESLLMKRNGSSFPSYESIGVILNAHQNTQMDYTMNFRQSNHHIHIAVSSNATASYLSMDTNFNVLSSTFNVTESSLIEKINYTTRIAQRNELDEVLFTFFKNKKLIKKKGVYYTKNTLDTFSIIPVLQHISSLNAPLIHAEFSVQHMAIRVPVIIEQSTNSSLTPFLSRYTVPEELLGMIDNESGYTVYTLKVTGWQGLIYNHRHYYVFSAESPYFYVGHWGGPDQTNLFSWSLRLNR